MGIALIIFAALAFCGMGYGVYWLVKREIENIHKHIASLHRTERHTQDQNRRIIAYQMDLLGYRVPDESYRSPNASDPWLDDDIRQKPVSSPTNPYMPAPWLATVMKGDSNG